MASLGSLVIELAANTAALQSDLGRAVTLTQNAVGKMRSLFRGLGALGVGAGLADIARQAIELGDELEKGAKRAGITASEFSKLSAAAKQTDVDMIVLSRGIKDMQVALSKGDEAFRAIGLSIAALKGQSATVQIGQITDALNRLNSQEDRVRYGAEIFGKSYQELVPFLSEGERGIHKLIDAQIKLGATFSDEQIRKLSATDDAIKNLKAAWTGFSTTLTATVAPALTGFFKLFTARQSESIAEIENELFRAMARSFPTDEIQRRLAAAKKAAQEVEPQRIGSRQSNSIQFIEDAKAAAAEAKKLAAEQEAAAKAAAKAVASQSADFVESFAEFQRGVVDHAAAAAKATRTSIEVQIDDIHEWEANLNEALIMGAINWEQYAARMQEFNDEVLSEIVLTSKYAEKPLKQMSEFAKQAARNMQTYFADFLFDPLSDGFNGMLKGFVDTLRRMLAEAAASKLFEWIGGALSSRGGWIGAIGSFISGARAEGGPVSAGGTYLVGERGPELLTMGGSGYVSANMGGGIVVNMPVDARGATVDAIQYVNSVLPQTVRAAADLAIATINDNKRRGR